MEVDLTRLRDLSPQKCKPTEKAAAGAYTFSTEEFTEALKALGGKIEKKVLAALNRVYFKGIKELK
jgi:hypothetical protein